jgi:hypothetical protein
MSHPRRVAPLLFVALLLTRTEAASAWDPFGDGADDPDPVTPSDPAPYVIPEGIYLVTDVYTADVVTTSGDTTTYSTSTTHETPGTYARVVDTVGTGVDSAFDGASFNGRARLADGRPVGGTYYEDFVLTAGGFVSVNVVFFQDDSDTRTRTAGPTVTTASPTASPTAPPIAQPTAPIALPPVPSERLPGPIETPVPAPTPRLAVAVVALAPLGPALDSIEVLRGRSVRLFLRATSDGVPVPVRAWRLVTGNADVLSRREGGGADTCDAVWLTLPPPGSVWSLRFEVTSDLVPGRTLIATLGVAVRSPALGE